MRGCRLAGSRELGRFLNCGQAEGPVAVGVAEGRRHQHRVGVVAVGKGLWPALGEIWEQWPTFATILSRGRVSGVNWDT